MKDSKKTIVYYNSACPVCDAGIGAQKSKMPACDMVWVDVQTHPEAVIELGMELEAVRERLHVKTEAGQLVIGSEALTTLWSKTPSQQKWSRLAQWPIVRELLAIGYNVFARCLYQWNRWEKRW